MFKFLVLGLLRDEPSMHGYALMKASRLRSGITIGSGNFYRELQKLTALGLVRTASNPADADPRRAPYSITALGVEALEAWLAAPERPALGPYHDELSTRAVLIDIAHDANPLRGLDLWELELSMLEKALEGSIERGSVSRGRAPSQAHDARSIILGRCLAHTRVDLAFVRHLRGQQEDVSNGGGSADHAGETHSQRPRTDPEQHHLSNHRSARTARVSPMDTGPRAAAVNA